MRDDEVTLRLVRQLANEPDAQSDLGEAPGHSLEESESAPSALDSAALLEALIASDFDLFQAILRWGHDA